MTDVQPELNMLALNSGSSSLKFGLYHVGSFRTEMLLSGAAELIGEKNGKFFAQEFARNRFALRDGIHSQLTGSDHMHRKTSRQLQNAGTGRRRA